MTLHKIRDLYKAVLPGKAFHYFARKKDQNYLVWAEEKIPTLLKGDNKVQKRKITGTTDYFTKEEYDPVVKQIEEAMNQGQMSWECNSIQREEETGYIHYEWIWEVYDG